MPQICDICQINSEKCYCVNSDLDSEAELEMLKQEEDEMVETTKTSYQQLTDAKNLVTEAYDHIISTSEKQLVPCFEKINFDSFFEFIFPDKYEAFMTMFVTSFGDELTNAEDEPSSIVVGRVKPETATSSEIEATTLPKAWNKP